MATDQQRAEKYADWLVSNKDKQGTAEWNTVSSAYRELRQGMSVPAEQEAEPSMLSRAGSALTDIGKGLGSGVVRGVEGALSLPDLAAEGVSFLLEKPMGLLGMERVTEEEKQRFAEASPMTGRLGLFNIREDIVEPTATALGARYEPQTVAGELAQRTGELLPFAPTRPLTFAAAPAAAGYAAEKTAEKAGAGEGLQLAARIAGEIAAPVPAAKTLETVRAISDLRKSKNLREIAKSPNLTETQATRVNRAANLEDEGIKVSTGQALGDEALKRSEAQSTRGADFAQSQLEDFTAAVMGKLGSTSRTADAAALIEVQNRLGGIMNQITSGTNLKISAGDARKASKAMQKFKRLKPSGAEIEDMNNYFARVNRRIAEGITKPLSPDEYISFRQELSRLTTRSEKAVRETANEMLNIVDDAMDKTLSDLGRAGDFEKLNKARSMYRDFFALEDAAKKAAGDFITPSAMASALKKQSGRQYTQRQRGDLGNLVADADEVLKFPRTSGSAENIATIIGPVVARMGARGVAGYQVAGMLGLPPEIGAAVANIGPATFDRLALTDKGRQYLIKKMVESDPTFFTEQNARMIVGSIATALKGQEQ